MRTKSVGVLIVAMLLFAACSSTEDNRSSGSPSGTGGSAPSSATSPGSAPDVEGGSDVLVPIEAADWPFTVLEDCSAYVPRESREVVVVPELRDDCFAGLALEVTKVFVAPQSRPLMDEDWSQVTTPWVSLDGHQIMRRTRGAMTRLSARDAAAAMCEGCGGYVVIMGPGATGIMDGGLRHVDSGSF